MQEEVIPSLNNDLQNNQTLVTGLNKSADSVSTSPIASEEPTTLKEFYKSVSLKDITKKFVPMSSEEAVALSKSANIPSGTIEEMAAISGLNGVAQGYRPVNPAALNAIIEHGAVGKGFDIKGKSATEGPLEGLVPLNQGLSKIGSQKFSEEQVQQISKFNHYNEDGLAIKDNNGYANLGIYTPTSEDGKDYYAFFDPKNGTPLKDDNGKIVYAHKREDGSYENINEKDSTVNFEGFAPEVAQAIGYVQKHASGEPIIEDKDPMVRPVTADADQFTQGMIIEEKETKGIVIDSLVKSMGYSDAQGAALSGALIGATKGMGLVKHFDESGNPNPENFAEGEAHLFLIPEPIRNDSGVITGITTKGVICNTEQEIVNLYNDPKNKEFNLKINPLWGWKRETEKDNVEGKLVVDPERMNAQRLHLKINEIKADETLSAEIKTVKCNAAEAIINSVRRIGELNAQPLDMEGREDKLKTTNEDLSNLRSSFANDFKEDFLSKGEKAQTADVKNLLNDMLLDEDIQAIGLKQNEVLVFHNSLNISSPAEISNRIILSELHHSHNAPDQQNTEKSDMPLNFTDVESVKSANITNSQRIRPLKNIKLEPLNPEMQNKAQNLGDVLNQDQSLTIQFNAMSNKKPLRAPDSKCEAVLEQTTDLRDNKTFAEKILESKRMGKGTGIV